MPVEAAIEERRDTAARIKPIHWRALWFLVLPSVFLVLHGVFLGARGPFYLGHTLDPDYAYLCNSLNIATRHRPFHTDHPGTCLQVFGAGVIIAEHPFAKSQTRIDAVLRNPEQHLRAINFALAGIYAVGLLLVGIVVWRRTGQWQPALFFQAAPFMLGDQFGVVTRVSAEPLLLIVGLLMSALLFLEAAAEQPRSRTVVWLSFLGAVGVITKLSFLPLSFVPLPWLRTWRQRGLYLLTGGAFACMWLLLLGSRALQVINWGKNLLLHQRRYGSGEEGIFPPEYLAQFARLVTENPWLTLSVGLSCVTVIYGCARWKNQTPAQRRWVLLLCGLAAAQTLQMLMVAKYAVWRYLLPGLMFCPLTTVLMIAVWGAKWPKARSFFWAAALAMVVSAAAGLAPLHGQTSKYSASRMRIVGALETGFKNEPRVYYYGASSPYHALGFGNYWAGSRYTKKLKEIFSAQPPSYIVEEGTGALRSFDGKRAFLDEIGQDQRSFLLIGAKSLAPRISGFLPRNARTETLLQAPEEVITRVTLPEPGAQ